MHFHHPRLGIDQPILGDAKALVDIESESCRDD
jgi:hypothetical protein